MKMMQRSLLGNTIKFYRSLWIRKKKLRKRKSTLKRSITVEQITKIMSKVQRKAESGGKKSSNNVSIGIKLALREITKELKKKSSSSVNNTDNPDLEIKKKMQSE